MPKPWLFSYTELPGYQQKTVPLLQQVYYIKTTTILSLIFHYKFQSFNCEMSPLKMENLFFAHLSCLQEIIVSEQQLYWQFDLKYHV